MSREGDREDRNKKRRRYMRGRHYKSLIWVGKVRSWVRRVKGNKEFKVGDKGSLDITFVV